MKVYGGFANPIYVIGRDDDGTVMERVDFHTKTRTYFREIWEVKGADVDVDVFFFNKMMSDPELRDPDEKPHQVVFLSKPYTGGPGRARNMWWD
jgi:hypothetical protein